MVASGSKRTGSLLAHRPADDRKTLLDLLDQLAPKIQELMRTLEEVVKKRPWRGD